MADTHSAVAGGSAPLNQPGPPGGDGGQWTGGFPTVLAHLLATVHPLGGHRVPRVGVIVIAAELATARTRLAPLPDLVRGMGGRIGMAVPLAAGTPAAEVWRTGHAGSDLLLVSADEPQVTGTLLTPALDPELTCRWHRPAGAPVLSVPADPERAELALALLAWPILRVMSGNAERFPRTIVARSARALRSPAGLRSLVPTTLACQPEGGSARLGPVTAHPRGQAPPGAFQAPGWLVIPEAVTAVAAGERCAVLLAPGRGLISS